MGRWIVLFLVLLALAAAINVAAAWTCVLVQDELDFDGVRLGQLRAAEFEGHGAQRREGDPEVWLQHVFSGRGVEIIQLRTRTADDRLERSPMQGDVQTSIHRAGWPMASLEGRVHKPLIDQPDSSVREWVLVIDGDVSLEFPPVTQQPGGAGQPLRPPILTTFALPLRPLWPGFAVNTFLLAAVPILLWALVRTTLVLRRLARGECTRCGYPIGQSPRCSECGHAVRPRPAAALR